MEPNTGWVQNDYGELVRVTTTTGNNFGVLKHIRFDPDNVIKDCPTLKPSFGDIVYYENDNKM